MNELVPETQRLRYDGPNKAPFCLKCQHTVEEFGYEIDTMPLYFNYELMGWHQTSVKYWIKCHGESWSQTFPLNRVVT